MLKRAVSTENKSFFQVFLEKRKRFHTILLLLCV